MKTPFRAKHLLKSVRLYLRDGYILRDELVSITPKTLLIVKTDAIGDYLLFRNFLEDIRTCEKFSNFKITLCGNEIWKDIALTFDKEFVNEFIWVSKSGFVSDMRYRKQLLMDIHNHGFEYAFQPTYSRELGFGDSIIRASGARYRIGSKGDDASELAILKSIGDGIYTQLLTSNDSPAFEFDKNKSIVEEFLGRKIARQRPSFINFKGKPSSEKYAILFPGAGEIQKQWPPEYFAKVADELWISYSIKVKICGSIADKELGDQIVSLCRNSCTQNICGSTDLLNLIELINSASILITNDSSALHVAACTGTKTICILNGRHYGRFAPYPKGMASHLHFLFPEKIKYLLEQSIDDLFLITKYNSPASINEIDSTKVISMLATVIS